MQLELAMYHKLIIFLISIMFLNCPPTPHQKCTHLKGRLKNYLIAGILYITWSLDESLSKERRDDFKLDAELHLKMYYLHNEDYKKECKE